MSTVLELRESVAGLSMITEARDSLWRTAGMIPELNKEMLHRGWTTRGKRMRKYRNPKYAEMKNAMNPEPGLGFPDLMLTGDFYRGFGVEVSDEGFEVFSTDPKADPLEHKYGDIFGLGEREKGEYIDKHFAPDLQRAIEEKTGLTFNS